jgi:late competence protein required for DNA uptake (superfamily II DNA/RNA helicase)
MRSDKDWAKHRCHRCGDIFKKKTLEDGSTSVFYCERCTPFGKIIQDDQGGWVR